MRIFLILLVLLGLAGGGVYYGKPELLDKLGILPATTVAEPSASGQVPVDSVISLPFLDNQEARARARAEGHPVLIIWHGSDWLPRAAALIKEWRKLEKKNLPLVLGQIDEKLGFTPDLNDREKLLPVAAFTDLPVAVLLAPDDTLLGIYTGKVVQTAAALENAVQKTLARTPEYMALVEQARTVEGVQGARAAAQALAMQPYATACRNRQLKDILNRKDPAHETKMRFLYGMDHMGMYDEINAVLNGGKGADAKFKGPERKFAEAAAFAQSILALPGVNKTLQQQWTSGLAYIYREQYRQNQDADVRSRLVECYRKVVAIDPESEYGKGAARWARYWDESVPYEFDSMFYDSGDMTTDFEKEWRVDVSKLMKGAGVYTFSLHPSKNGRMTTRGFQLYAGGKHVCDASGIPADKDTKSVTFQVPAPLKGKVEVRFKARCFDGWFNCAGEMQMKKGGVLAPI